MIVELHAKTDIGRVRQANEDNLLILDLTTGKAWTGVDGAETPEDLSRLELGAKGLILVVSDGMGGALAGDVASRMAVEGVREMMTGGEEDGACAEETPLVDCLWNATVYANLAIHHRSLEDARYIGMGATFTGAAITNNRIGLVQVGDSRAYIIRGYQIKLATKDQSLVQQLVDVGQITEEEAETHMFRNVILQALGAQSEVRPEIGYLQIKRGDLLLLCSDGLSGKLRADDMLQIIQQSQGNLIEACAGLVAEANERGGEDNITVVLARFTGDDLPMPDTDAITIEMPQTFDNDDDTLGSDDETMELPQVDR